MKVGGKCNQKKGAVVREGKNPRGRGHGFFAKPPGLAAPAAGAAAQMDICQRERESAML